MTTERAAEPENGAATSAAAPAETVPATEPPQPEPEGARAAAFRQVFERALATTLKKSSYQNFASCFPTPAKRNPKLLEHIWNQMNTYWESHSKKEFEKILLERNVVPNLNELDRLIEEAKERKKTAAQDHVPVKPSELQPEEIVAAHLAPLYEQATPKLQEEIDRIGKENQELIEQVRKQREEMRTIIDTLTKAVGDLEGMQKVLGESAAGIPEAEL